MTLGNFSFKLMIISGPTPFAGRATKTGSSPPDLIRSDPQPIYLLVPRALRRPAKYIAQLNFFGNHVGEASGCHGFASEFNSLEPNYLAVTG